MWTKLVFIPNFESVVDDLPGLAFLRILWGLTSDEIGGRENSRTDGCSSLDVAENMRSTFSELLICGG